MSRNVLPLEVIATSRSLLRYWTAVQVTPGALGDLRRA